MCVAGAAGVQLLEVGDAREPAVEAIEARLKLLLDAGQHAAAAAPRPPGSGASMPSLGDRHAARIVHQDGDDVLLRLELGDQ